MTDKTTEGIDDAAERRQTELEQMHAGDIALILKNVHSKIPFHVMSAILAGAKYKVTLPEFLAGVEAARNNETVFLGIRVKEMAEATWYYVQGFRYDGENDTVKRLISELPKI